MEENREKIIIIAVKIIVTVLAIGSVILLILPASFFAVVILFSQPPSVFIYSSVLLLALTLIIFSVKKASTMAFADPYKPDYKRKTNKELYSFVAWSYVTAFVYAVFSLMTTTFMYVSLIYWFYFIIFMIMFARVWKFHGKKRRYLFLILIPTMIAAFFAAPFIKSALLELLHYLNIY